MPQVPWLGALALAASVLLYDLLLGGVRRLDRAYPSTNLTESTWWFGYARDLANLAGLCAFTLSFGVMGFARHLALLAGFSMMLCTYGLDYTIARGMSARRAELYLGLVMLLATIPIYRLRAPLEAGLGALLTSLFNVG